MKDNFFVDVDRLRCIDTYRIIYLVLAVVAFVTTEAGRYIYRPYIYKNDINDFGLADSIGNLGGIMVQIFFTLFMLNSPWPKSVRLILLLVGGYIAYEVIQPYLPKGVFDWLDVYGTLVGGIFAIAILLVLKSIPLRNRTIFRF